MLQWAFSIPSTDWWTHKILECLILIICQIHLQTINQPSWVLAVFQCWCRVQWTGTTTIPSTPSTPGWSSWPPPAPRWGWRWWGSRRKGGTSWRSMLVEGLRGNQLYLLKEGSMPGYKEYYILNIICIILPWTWSVKTSKFPPFPLPAYWSLCNTREWISPATVTFILRELVTNPTYSHLVDMFHWIIIPVLNPDGYVYTHTKVLQNIFTNILILRFINFIWLVYK